VRWVQQVSKCKICRAEFTKRSMTHKACSPECAIELGKRQKQAKERKEIRKRKLALKTRTQWLKEAQIDFNRYIRERDRLAGLPCISCGRFHTGSYDAGHYRSVGAAPQLRFHEDNCHRQCVPCNQHKSGNAIEYRIKLVERIGRERVEALESDNSVKKYTIAEAQAIRAEYRDKLMALGNANVTGLAPTQVEK